MPHKLFWYLFYGELGRKYLFDIVSPIIESYKKEQQSLEVKL
jgi:hypothetical protein